MVAATHDRPQTSAASVLLEEPELMLMGAAPSVVAATHDRPQTSAASVLLEEPESTYLRAAALDID